MIQALNEEENWNTGWVKVYRSIANDFLYPNPDNLLVFADNHDMSRVYSQLGQSLEKTKMALAVLLTTRGIPQIYYGTEVLLDNTPSNDHGDIRIDFPGGFAGQNSDAKSGRGLSAQQQQMQSFTRKLLHLRRQNPALQHGKLIHYSPFDGIYAYVSQSPEQTLLVLHNKKPQATQIELGRFAKHLKGFSGD